MAFVLSKENFMKLAEFIYRKSGVYLEYEKHFDKLGKYTAARSKELGFDNFRKYFFTLRFDDKKGKEFQELINAITVNETYFFREKEQLEVLSRKVLHHLHATMPSSKTLRILSAPCSSGEEAYSIVLNIVNEGNVVEQRDIEVVGIDIDSSVIQKAKRAEYSERSVHALPKDMLQRWFEKSKKGYVLGEELQGTVDFQVVNVFDREQMRKLGKFDVIFSRNMLIYFDDASRKEVAMTFYDMLNPGGYIFLGHAEYMSRIVSVFEAQKIDNILVYKK